MRKPRYIAFGLLYFFGWLFLGSYVHAAALLTGQTPASYLLPEGWSLVKANDFEGGCGSNGNCTIGQSSVGSGPGGVSHSGTQSVKGTYTKDGDQVAYVTYPGGYTEVYLSWYDYVDSTALFADEYYIANFMKRNADDTLKQELIIDYIWCGQNLPNNTNCKVDIQAGGEGAGYSLIGTYDMNTSVRVLPVGQWVQFEVHYRPNTPGSSNGFMHVYMTPFGGSTQTWMNVNNFNMNGAVDMTQLYAYIGGTYTQLIWSQSDPNIIGSGACSFPAQCGNNSDGCRNFIGYTDLTFANPRCGPTHPSFTRYIDDVIVMALGSGTTPPPDPPGEDLQAPAITNLNPPESGTGIPLASTITFNAIDNRSNDTGVSLSSIKVTVAGTTERKSKSEILSYLTNLPTLSAKKVLSGQYIGALNEGHWDIGGENEPWMQWLAIPPRSGGLYPAFMEVGVDWYEFGTSPIKDDVCGGSPCPDIYSAEAIAHVKRGGLIGASWHAISPDDNLGDGTRDLGVTITLSEIYTPGNARYTNFRLQMDKVAAYLQGFKDAGVTVLFRPFHEMNGDYFWWSTRSGSAAEFITAWIYLYNYMTTTKGLSNILWVYSPEATEGKSKTAHYPGSGYVNIVSMDLYTDDFPYNAGYDDLKALGKPFMLGELGPAVTASTYYAYDVNRQITGIRNSYADTVVWSNWAWFWSMPGLTAWDSDTYGNTGVEGLLKDSWVVTREDLPSGHTYTCASGLTCGGSSGSRTVSFTPTGGVWTNGEVVQVKIEASDVAGNVMTPKLFSFTASGTPGTLTITTTTLTAGRVGDSLSTTIATSGGSGTKTFALSAGALPPGVTLAPSGVLAGIPAGTFTVYQNYTFTIQVTDALSATDTQAYTWRINPRVPGGGGTKIFPVSDTYINLGQPTTNYVSGSTISTFIWPAGISSEKMLLYFALDNVPTGALINYATLQMHLANPAHQGDGGTNPARIYVFKSSAFNTSTVTWNNQSFTVGEYESYADVGTTGGELIAWDITTAMNEAIGASENLYLVVDGWVSGLIDTNRIFDSSETGNGPEIVFDYMIDTPSISAPGKMRISSKVPFR
jgi:mannan endo-1,4-beta-mannosidase